MCDQRSQDQDKRGRKKMRQFGQKRWLTGGLAAGLTMAAMVHGTAFAAPETGNPAADEAFHRTEYVTEGIAAIQQNAVGGGAVQAIVQGSNAAVIQNVTVTQSSAVNDQTQGGGTAGQGQNAVLQSGGTAGQGQSAVLQAGGAADRAQGAVQAGSVNGQAQGAAPQTGNADSQTGNAASQSGVVAAGQHRSSDFGPGMYGTITTEGENAQMGQQAPQDAILGGATLTLLNSQTSSQMLSAIIQTKQGKLIVVDGGLGDDGEYLRSQLQARGGQVAAWLITHPHGDHAGALYKILQDAANGIPSGINIEGIYYSFAAPEWYTVHDPQEASMAHSIIGTFAGLPQTMLHPVGRGQTIQVDDVTIQVMNDRYELASDKGNNASIVYKVYVNGKSILFLGDLGEEGGTRLLNEVGAQNLKSDIVQMSHHGQGGVNEAFYQAVSPSICLWPTPQWLWNNEGARYKIPQTKAWMGKLNVQKHYVMKDGDQVLR